MCYRHSINCSLPAFSMGRIALLQWSKWSELHSWLLIMFTITLCRSVLHSLCDCLAEYSALTQPVLEGEMAARVTFNSVNVIYMRVKRRNGKFGQVIIREVYDHVLQFSLAHEERLLVFAHNSPHPACWIRSRNSDTHWAVGTHL